MDSVSHIHVANLLMDHIERTCGITFEKSGFLYGNLKPDLTGTYLTKRHYPSLMMEEVIEKIHTFVEKYTIGTINGHDLSVDLGEICHFITDFFTFPHNDDIYHRNLLAHYIYEKRIALIVRRRLTEERYNEWIDSVIPTTSVDALITRLLAMHNDYRIAAHHNINDDLMNISRATVLLVRSIINIVYEQVEEPIAAIA